MSEITDSEQRDFITKWLDKNAGSAQGPRLIWHNLLVEAAELPIADIELILNEQPSSEVFRVFLRLLKRNSSPAEAMAIFFENLNDSESPLKDWLDALLAIYKFSERTSIRPSLSGASGYIHCAAMMIGTGDRYETLSQSVQTMLELYGYEGRTEN